MDLMGHQHQFLPPQIQPLRDDMIVVGRAMPVLEADDAGGEGPGRANAMLNQPFGLMLKALDDLQQNEVYVCTGSSPTYALWGELMSTAARARGAAGAVLAGYTRDTQGILAMDFPVFSYGSYGQDQKGRGKVVDFRLPLEIEGVRVQPGDIVFGDVDGVVVLPCEWEEIVVPQALALATKEKTARKLLQEGASAESVFSETGVL